MSTSASTRPSGWAVVQSAVSRSVCSQWLAIVDAAYERLDVSPSPDFVPESSSFRLCSIAELPVTELWSELSGEVHERTAALLGPRVAIAADQCWVRRQYAPHAAPPRHHPHSWHQDGALGFDFVRHVDAAIPDDALLPMVTCWIALTPCGVDAPGLEIVPEPIDRPLVPTELTEPAVDARWPSSQRIRPMLDVGDALVFSGDVLHRTHASTAMTRTRTSLELRAFHSAVERRAEYI